LSPLPAGEGETALYSAAEAWRNVITVNKHLVRNLTDAANLNALQAKQNPRNGAHPQYHKSARAAADTCVKIKFG